MRHKSFYNKKTQRKKDVKNISNCKCFNTEFIKVIQTTQSEPDVNQ